MPFTIITAIGNVVKVVYTHVYKKPHPLIEKQVIFCVWPNVGSNYWLTHRKLSSDNVEA